MLFPIPFVALFQQPRQRTHGQLAGTIVMEARTAGLPSLLRYLGHCTYSPTCILVTRTTQTDKVLELVRKVGVLRPRDLDPYDIPRTYLSCLCVADKLQHIGRGLYDLPDSDVTVHVYFPTKTIADCFKYRNKIGLDVAIEALREYRRARHCTMDDLWHYADICHARNVMRPYLELLAT